MKKYKNVPQKQQKKLDIWAIVGITFFGLIFEKRVAIK